MIDENKIFSIYDNCREEAKNDSSCCFVSVLRDRLEKEIGTNKNKYLAYKMLCDSYSWDFVSIVLTVVTAIIPILLFNLENMFLDQFGLIVPVLAVIVVAIVILVSVLLIRVNSYLGKFKKIKEFSAVLEEVHNEMEKRINKKGEDV